MGGISTRVGTIIEFYDNVGVYFVLLDFVLWGMTVDMWLFVMD